MRSSGPHRPVGGLRPRLESAVVRGIAALVTAVLVAVVHTVWHQAGRRHAPGAGTVLEGRARAIDGDTLVLEGEHVRLLGIDAPELDQPCGGGARTSESWACGLAAREALVGLLGRPVVCRSQGRDRYHRVLARCVQGGFTAQADVSQANVSQADVSETDIGRAMVRRGWAINLEGYAGEQDAARAAGLGIWTGGFEDPAQWRREKRLDPGQIQGPVDAD